MKIVFLNRIQSISKWDASKSPSVAMHRSISSYTVYNGETSFTISNLMGILIVTLYSMDSKEQWINTKINLGIGSIEARNQNKTSVVGQEIQHCMNQSKAAKNNLLPTQKKKIEEKLENIGDEIKKTYISGL